MTSPGGSTARSSRSAGRPRRARSRRRPIFALSCRPRPDGLMRAPRLGLPALGFGLGLRSCHFHHLLKNPPRVAWFEIISENFMDDHGFARHVLLSLAREVPIVMHGVSLSIGSTDPLDMDYLRGLSALAELISPAWISDHLCWTSVGGYSTHDLLPLPLTEEALQ